jgi:hypothetical protein
VGKEESARLTHSPPDLPWLCEQYLDTSSRCRVSPLLQCPHRGIPECPWPGTCGSGAASRCHMSWSTSSMRSTAPTCHQWLREKGSVRGCRCPHRARAATCYLHAKHSPGHSRLLHSRVSVRAPVHVAQAGPATLHFRLRCWVPLAQDDEHGPQGPHSSHWPSTAWETQAGVAVEQNVGRLQGQNTTERSQNLLGTQTCARPDPLEWAGMSRWCLGLSLPVCHQLQEHRTPLHSAQSGELSSG